jgi:hypothetical protein
MKRFAILALLMLSPIAFAHNCPNEMKAIDAELASTKVAGVNLEKVKALRAEGEKAHKDGKHAESMKALGEAEKILGI